MVAFLCCLAGCQSAERQPPSHAPLLSSGKEELYRNYDNEVIVTGLAAAAPREGVVVVMNDGTRVLIPELPDWPRRAQGRIVSVTGMLQRVPAAVTASAGDAAPKPDDRFLLKGVRWTLGRATTQP